MDIINWEDKQLSLNFLGQFYNITCQGSYVRHAEMIDHMINIILDQQERIKSLEIKLTELTTGEKNA